jgi:hypothetical protein
MTRAKYNSHAQNFHQYCGNIKTRTTWKNKTLETYIGGIWTLLPDIAEMHFILKKIPHKLS